MAAKLEAARQAAKATQTAVDARLEAINAERVLTERARREAEARAQEAIGERDVLAAELDAARAAMPDILHDQQLEAAVERIRVLELELFERGHALKDRDVELGPLLEGPTPPSEQAARRATRYRFPAALDVQIDGDPAVLVDLSVGGAQVISARELEVNHLATLTLTSDETPTSCEGRIVWSWLEPHVKGRPSSYRAGISFTGADEAAIEVFIIQYSTS